jgi:hypothetical protein
MRPHRSIALIQRKGRQAMATKYALTLAQVAADLRIRSRTAPRTHVPRSDSRPPDRYFTDGVNLYRFVGWVNRSVNAMLAELEDC